MLAQIEAAFRSRAQSEAAARESEQRMRRFVADASHELRTPLTSIRGFAELYRQGAVRDADATARLMRRIEDEAARMGLLVDDLLLLARLDQQRPLERQRVDLLAVATDAVHDARVVAPERRIDLRLAPGLTAPVVVGDEARLRQVVGNLVTNALTHTPEDTAVTVALATEEAHGAGRVVLEVRDRGPGLAPGDAERVFERFYRADSSRTRSSGGSGLGLSIVAALIAAHGGTVGVTSRVGSGTTFRVVLPAGDA
jgi:two-component system OmpR family sensor kinase